MRTTWTGIFSIVISALLVLTLNGCSTGSVVLVNDSHEIRPGTDAGWVQISEGYLREIVEALDQCQRVHWKAGEI